MVKQELETALQEYSRKAARHLPVVCDWEGKRRYVTVRDRRDPETLMLEFTEQQWQESKAGLQAQLSERDANLRSRGQRLWVSIGNKDLGFDQRERVCDEVGKLSRADLVRFITQLRSRTSDRLILCSYGQGHEHDERITGQFIDDPRAFRLNAATFEG